MTPELNYLRARYAEEAAAALEARGLGLIHTNGAEAAEVTVAITWQWHLQASYSNNGYATSIVPGAPAPQAVLDDLKAKLAILDMHERGLTMDAYRMRYGAEPHTEIVLRVLLQAYAGREDFDQRWKL